MSPELGTSRPGNHPQHRGLAATAGAEQGHQLAILDRETDLVHGGDAAEMFADVFEFDAHEGVMGRI
jgi:hypothetical protein